MKTDSLEANLKSVRSRFYWALASGSLLILLSTLVLNEILKEQAATVVTDATRGLLKLEMNREALLTIDSSAKNFCTIMFIDKHGQKKFSFPPEVKKVNILKRSFLDKIAHGISKREIYMSRTDGRALAGELYFKYSRGDYLAYALIFVILLAGCLIYFLRTYEIKVIEEHEKLMKLKSSAALGELAQSIVHDMKWPLGQLEQLSDFEDKTNDSFILRLKDAIQSIRETTQKLLENHGRDKTSVIKKEIKQNFTPQLVPAIVREVVEKRQHEFSEWNEIKINFETKGDYKRMLSPVDRTGLIQSISNLINNSIEAMQESIEINISVFVSAANWIEIKIQDNGLGMSKEVLSKLLDGQKYISTKDSGSGLGVYFSKKFVESFNGRFYIESTPGSGTTTTLLLPTADKVSRQITTLDFDSSIEFLILDDSESIRNAWTAIFANYGINNKFHIFGRSSEVLNWIEENQPDKHRLICLFDYNLEGDPMNGPDVAVAAGLLPNTVIVTFASTDDAVKTECFELGLPLVDKGQMDELIGIRRIVDAIV